MARAVPLTILTAALLAVSCIGNTVQHQYRHIGSEGWDRNDTLTFAIPPARVSGTHSISTELRTSTAFPYTKVCMVREVMLTRPLAALRDTVCVDTEVNGISPDASGVTIKSYSHTDSLLVLREGQEGTVRLYHIMSKETIPHILDVGIKIKTIR